MDENRVHLTVQLPAGAAMFPSWLTFVFVALFVISSIALALTWQANRELEREMRILQVHVQDVENILIRHGSANQQDFVSWPRPSTKSAQSPKSGEEP